MLDYLSLSFAVIQSFMSFKALGVFYLSCLMLFSGAVPWWLLHVRYSLAFLLNRKCSSQRSCLESPHDCDRYEDTIPSD